VHKTCLLKFMMVLKKSTSPEEVNQERLLQGQDITSPRGAKETKGKLKTLTSNRIASQLNYI